MLGALILLFWSFTRLKSDPQHAHSILLRKGDLKVPRIDVEGWILLVLAIAVPLVAFTLADNVLAWSNPFEIALLAVAPAVVFSFVFFEAKVASTPVVDMTPIFNLRYLSVLFQEFLVMSILNSVNMKYYDFLDVLLTPGTDRLHASTIHPGPCHRGISICRLGTELCFPRRSSRRFHRGLSGESQHVSGATNHAGERADPAHVLHPLRLKDH